VDGNDARAALVRSIHGNDAAEELTGRLSAERDAHRTFREVTRSPAARPDPDQLGGPGAQAALQLATGRPGAALRTVLWETAQGHHAGRYAQGLKEELGGMMVDTNPLSVEETMRLVQQRRDLDARSAARLARGVALGSKATTIRLAGTNGDYSGMYDEGPEEPAEEPEYGPYDPRDPTLGRLPGDWE
jgi:hypothetical protein